MYMFETPAFCLDSDFGAMDLRSTSKYDDSTMSKIAITSPEGERLLEAIKKTNFDDKFVDRYWRVEQIELVSNPRLEKRYESVKNELKTVGRKKEDLDDVFVFSAETEKVCKEFCREGHKVGLKKRHVLGYTGSGVHVVRNFDILSRYMTFQQITSPAYIMVYKAFLGKAKPIVPRLHKDDNYVSAWSGFDCHISARRIEPSMTICEALNCSYVYFYEYDDIASNTVKYPRQLLPHAVIQLVRKYTIGVETPFLAVGRHDKYSGVEVQGETRRGFRFTYPKPNKKEKHPYIQHRETKEFIKTSLQSQLLEMRTKGDSRTSFSSPCNSDSNDTHNNTATKLDGNPMSTLPSCEAFRIRFNGVNYCVSPPSRRPRCLLQSSDKDCSDTKVKSAQDQNQNNSKSKSWHTRRLPLSLKPYVRLKRLRTDSKFHGKQNDNTTKAKYSGKGLKESALNYTSGISSDGKQECTKRKCIGDVLYEIPIDTAAIYMPDGDKIPTCILMENNGLIETIGPQNETDTAVAAVNASGLKPTSSKEDTIQKMKPKSKLDTNDERKSHTIDTIDILARVKEMQNDGKKTETIHRKVTEVVHGNNRHVSEHRQKENDRGITNGHADSKHKDKDMYELSRNELTRENVHRELQSRQINSETVNQTMVVRANGKDNTGKTDTSQTVLLKASTPVPKQGTQTSNVIENNAGTTGLTNARSHVNQATTFKVSPPQHRPKYIGPTVDKGGIVIRTPKPNNIQQYSWTIAELEKYNIIKNHDQKTKGKGNENAHDKGAEREKVDNEIPNSNQNRKEILKEATQVKGHRDKATMSLNDTCLREPEVPPLQSVALPPSKTTKIGQSNNTVLQSHNVATSACNTKPSQMNIHTDKKVVDKACPTDPIYPSDKPTKPTTIKDLFKEPLRRKLVERIRTNDKLKHVVPVSIQFDSNIPSNAIKTASPPAGVIAPAQLDRSPKVASANTSNSNIFDNTATEVSTTPYNGLGSTHSPLHSEWQRKHSYVSEIQSNQKCVSPNGIPVYSARDTSSISNLMNYRFDSSNCRRDQSQKSKSSYISKPVESVQCTTRPPNVFHAKDFTLTIPTGESNRIGMQTGSKQKTNTKHHPMSIPYPIQYQPLPLPVVHVQKEMEMKDKTRTVSFNNVPETVTSSITGKENGNNNVKTPEEVSSRFSGKSKINLRDPRQVKTDVEPDPMISLSVTSSKHGMNVPSAKSRSSIITTHENGKIKETSSKEPSESSKKQPTLKIRPNFSIDANTAEKLQRVLRKHISEVKKNSAVTRSMPSLESKPHESVQLDKIKESNPFPLTNSMKEGLNPCHKKCSENGNATKPETGDANYNLLLLASQTVDADIEKTKENDVVVSCVDTTDNIRNKREVSIEHFDNDSQDTVIGGIEFSPSKQEHMNEALQMAKSRSQSMEDATKFLFDDPKKQDVSGETNMTETNTSGYIARLSTMTNTSKEAKVTKYKDISHTPKESISVLPPQGNIEIVKDPLHDFIDCNNDVKDDVQLSNSKDTLIISSTCSLSAENEVQLAGGYADTNLKESTFSTGKSVGNVDEDNKPKGGFNAFSWTDVCQNIIDKEVNAIEGQEKTYDEPPDITQSHCSKIFGQIHRIRNIDPDIPCKPPDLCRSDIIDTLQSLSEALNILNEPPNLKEESDNFSNAENPENTIQSEILESTDIKPMPDKVLPTIQETQPSVLSDVLHEIVKSNDTNEVNEQLHLIPQCQIKREPEAESAHLRESLSSMTDRQESILIHEKESCSTGNSLEISRPIKAEPTDTNSSVMKVSTLDEQTLPNEKTVTGSELQSNNSDTSVHNTERLPFLVDVNDEQCIHSFETFASYTSKPQRCSQEQKSKEIKIEPETVNEISKPNTSNDVPSATLIEGKQKAIVAVPPQVMPSLKGKTKPAFTPRTKAGMLNKGMKERKNIFDAKLGIQRMRAKLSTPLLNFGNTKSGTIDRVDDIAINSSKTHTKHSEILNLQTDGGFIGNVDQTDNSLEKNKVTNSNETRRDKQSDTNTVHLDTSNVQPVAPAGETAEKRNETAPKSASEKTVTLKSHTNENVSKSKFSNFSISRHSPLRSNKTKKRDIIPFDAVMKKKKEQYLKYKRGLTSSKFIDYTQFKQELKGSFGYQQYIPEEYSFKKFGFWKNRQNVHNNNFHFHRNPPASDSLHQEEYVPSRKQPVISERGTKLYEDPLENDRCISESELNTSTTCSIKQKPPLANRMLDIANNTTQTHQTDASPSMPGLAGHSESKESPQHPLQRKTQTNRCGSPIPRNAYSNHSHFSSKFAPDAKSRFIHRNVPFFSPGPFKKVPFNYGKSGYFSWRRKYQAPVKTFRNGNERMYVTRKGAIQTEEEHMEWKMFKERERIRDQIDQAVKEYRKTFENTGDDIVGDGKVSQYLQTLTEKLETIQSKRNLLTQPYEKNPKQREVKVIENVDIQPKEEPIESQRLISVDKFKDQFEQSLNASKQKQRESTLVDALWTEPEEKSKQSDMIEKMLREHVFKHFENVTERLKVELTAKLASAPQPRDNIGDKTTNQDKKSYSTISKEVGKQLEAIRNTSSHKQIESSSSNIHSSRHMSKQNIQSRESNRRNDSRYHEYSQNQPNSSRSKSPEYEHTKLQRNHSNHSRSRSDSRERYHSQHFSTKHYKHTAPRHRSDSRDRSNSLTRSDSPRRQSKGDQQEYWHYDKRNSRDSNQRYQTKRYSRSRSPDSNHHRPEAGSDVHSSLRSRSPSRHSYSSGSRHHTNSRSPSPNRQTNKFTQNLNHYPKQNYQSPGRMQQRSNSGSHYCSRSRSRSPNITHTTYDSRSRSRSPGIKHRNKRSALNYHARSRSRSPVLKKHRASSGSKYHSRSRSRSPESKKHKAYTWSKYYSRSRSRSPELKKHKAISGSKYYSRSRSRSPELKKYKAYSGSKHYSRSKSRSPDNIQHNSSSSSNNYSGSRPRSPSRTVHRSFNPEGLIESFKPSARQKKDTYSKRRARSRSGSNEKSRKRLRPDIYRDSPQCDKVYITVETGSEAREDEPTGEPLGRDDKLSREQTSFDKFFKSIVKSKWDDDPCEDETTHEKDNDSLLESTIVIAGNRQSEKRQKSSKEVFSKNDVSSNKLMFDADQIENNPFSNNENEFRNEDKEMESETSERVSKSNDSYHEGDYYVSRDYSRDDRSDSSDRRHDNSSSRGRYNNRNWRDMYTRGGNRARGWHNNSGTRGRGWYNKQDGHDRNWYNRTNDRGRGWYNKTNSRGRGWNKHTDGYSGDGYQNNYKHFNDNRRERDTSPHGYKHGITKSLKDKGFDECYDDYDGERRERNSSELSGKRNNRNNDIQSRYSDDNIVFIDDDVRDYHDAKIAYPTTGTQGTDTSSSVQALLSSSLKSIQKSYSNSPLNSDSEGKSQSPRPIPTICRR